MHEFRKLKRDVCDILLLNESTVSADASVYTHITVYLLIHRTAKNNYFENCPGIIVTDFYRACKVSEQASSCMRAS